MRKMNVKEMRAVEGGKWYCKCGEPKCDYESSALTKKGAYAKWCIHRLKHGNTPLYYLSQR